MSEFVFDFKEFEAFAKKWQDSQKEFEQFLRKFLLDMALRVIAEVKPKTPVDTGAMRAMWGVGNQLLVLKNAGTKWNDKKGQYQEQVALDPENSTVATVDIVENSFEIAIWNGMEYASMIEYGHRFTNGRWQEGRFILTVAVDRIQKQIPLRFEQQFATWLTERGMA